MSYFPEQPGHDPNLQQLTDSMQNVNIAQEQQSTRSGRKKRVMNHAFHTDLMAETGERGAGTFANGGQMQADQVQAEQYPQIPQLQAQQAQQVQNQPGFVPNGQLQPQPTNHANPSPALSESELLSVPVQRHLAETEYKNRQFLTFQNACPPPAGSQYLVVDQGNASPKLMRMSMYNIPTTKQLKNASKIPLGLMVRPFAPREFTDTAIPQVDLCEIGGPPRCRRCRAYVNPAMQHTNGYTMICNMCHYESPTNGKYAAPLDSKGIRVDYGQRPELYSGTVDFIVPPEYYFEEKEPVPLNHVFLIDVSASAYDLQAQMATASAIRYVLYGSGDDSGLPDGAKVCFIAYDKQLHFFNLDPRLTQTTLGTVSDLDDPFLPIHAGLFADPQESRHIIETTLLYIETMGASKIPEPCFGAALTVALQALSIVGGGKVTACLSSLPSWGPGALKVKLQGNMAAAEYDKEVLSASNAYFEALLKDYTKQTSGLDVFVVSRSPVDLANVGLVARSTGGVVKSWTDFNIERDEREFFNSFKNSVTRSTGYQGQLKVRCSSGLQVSKYYGAFATSGESTDPLLPILHEDSSVACEFEYDGKLNTKYDAHFQAALLYTSADGVRKVRVINAIISVTDRISDVFAFADQDTVLSLMLRASISKLPSMNLITLRNRLTLQVAELFANYRKLVAQHTSMPGQLVFPTGLKTLPMFVLSSQKSRAFKERVTNPDMRVQSVFNLAYSPTALVSSFLYPQLMAIHNLDEDECIFDQETGILNLPKSVPLSRSSLEYGGAYLMLRPTHLLLWLHTDVNPLLLQDLFGDHVTSLQQLDPNSSDLPEIDTHISLQLRNLCKYYAKFFLGSDFVPVHICRFRIDPNEAEFVEYLYEDQATDLTPSFPDYLTQLYKQVNSKMENSRTEKSEYTNLNDSAALSQKFVHF
ncbi:unnamed protein product [Kuraishia capsulata CBS 1993]|uniref:Uncharacterized protein n=1 Tax=Kuraishia capsulata CBS 1993 TaxID=1382522 RepID=W6MW23_9ASCO|nr:uncharacterized protein KUCA_T00002789001 [Kuraishia capsulata CBS 1993]CDK26815.1 unnamed protein product [Kuraishia capsulata CBS 1993]